MVMAICKEEVSMTATREIMVRADNMAVRKEAAGVIPMKIMITMATMDLATMAKRTNQAEAIAVLRHDTGRIGQH
jgi:hypothetical protein